MGWAAEELRGIDIGNAVFDPQAEETRKGEPVFDLILYLLRAQAL